jgi:hypothetical protein
MPFSFYLYYMAKAKKAAKKKTPMEELTKGYEELIAGKEIDPNGSAQFKKALKKAVKSRGAK